MHVKGIQTGVVLQYGILQEVMPKTMLLGRLLSGIWYSRGLHVVVLQVRSDTFGWAVKA